MPESTGHADGSDARRESDGETGGGRRDVTWDLLSEQISDLIIITDMAGVIFYASPSARTMGYEPHELVGLTGADLIHPDELERFLANRGRVHAEGGAHGQDREHRFRRRDGGWIWLEGNPTILPGADGRPAGVLNVFRDVSDRRAAREALWEQARRASMMEEVAGLGYWRLDAETLEASWSEQMFRMFGLERGDTVALTLAMDMIHPDDKAEADARVAHSLATGEGWNEAVSRIIQPDGAVHYLTGRGVCETDANGKVTAVFGTVLDVTDQLVAKMALEDSERRYRLIAENATDMISCTALDGRMTYLSPAVERVTGYPVASLLNGQMRDHVHPDDLKDFLKAFTNLFAGKGEPGAIRFRARRRDGGWIWLESNPRLVRDADGAPLEIIDVTRDVTDQQALRDELREAVAAAESAAAVKGEFLANMSHEIRTPLTAVLGFASLLAERPDLDATAQGQVGRIVGAGRALLAVVNDVLDFSKLEAGEINIRRRPASPGQAAREVLEMFAVQAGSKGLDLRLDAALNLPSSLVMDEDRVRQILINLVGNAVKFTDRGRVTLALSYEAEDGQLVAEVRDTGVGIPAEAAAKLFQRFSQVDGSSTRSKGGTGLGLAICLGLTEAMGGSVSVESVVGEGSTFRLTLPALRGASEDPADASGDIIERLCGLRVLVVDDNAVNRELARAILEPAGVEISEAHGGREAVETAQSLPFDVILMDLRMPDMDGRTAVAAIRNEPGPNQHMPILAFSADGAMDLSAAENAGFQGVVRKPTSPAELLQALLRATIDEQDLDEGTAYAAVS